MKRQYWGIVLFAFLFVLFAVQPIISQVPAIFKYTLNSGASSTSHIVNVNGLHALQSIGQSSVIGLFKNNGLLIRQGFLQPVEAMKEIPASVNLKAKIYPNPFTTSVVVSFGEAITEGLFVSLIDISGRVIYTKMFAPAQDIIINLSTVSPGLYFLRIITNEKQLKINLIKD